MIHWINECSDEGDFDYEIEKKKSPEMSIKFYYMGLDFGSDYFYYNYITIFISVIHINFFY